MPLARRPREVRWSRIGLRATAGVSGVRRYRHAAAATAS